LFFLFVLQGGNLDLKRWIQKRKLFHEREFFAFGRAGDTVECVLRGFERRVHGTRPASRSDKNGFEGELISGGKTPVKPRVSGLLAEKVSSSTLQFRMRSGIYKIKLKQAAGSLIVLNQAENPTRKSGTVGGRFPGVPTLQRLSSLRRLSPA
jgi:hypothetical protein